MEIVPISELPAVDVDTLEAAVLQGGSPTNDDVTVLADGTRLDTPEKAGAWVREILRLQGRELGG